MSRRPKRRRWSTGGLQGLQARDDIVWQIIRYIRTNGGLESLDREDVYDEVEVQLHCTPEKAKSLAETAIKHLQRYPDDEEPGSGEEPVEG